MRIRASSFFPSRPAGGRFNDNWPGGAQPDQVTHVVNSTSIAPVAYLASRQASTFDLPPTPNGFDRPSVTMLD